MDELSIDDVILQLTDFYQKYLPDESGLQTLLDSMQKGLSFPKEDWLYANGYTTITDAPSLYTLPYYKLSVGDAHYSAARAMQLQRLSFEEQIRSMDANKEYILLSFGSSGSRRPTVYSMNLRIDFAGQVLTLYQDYFLRENRLYLLPSFVLNTERLYTHLHAFNIKIDKGTLETHFGSIFQVEAGPLIPRYRYREILQSFHKTLSSGLTIKDIKDGIAVVTGWEGFDIQDILSPRLSSARKRMYEQLMLSPSTFLVLMPEGSIKDKMEYNVMMSLLDEAKPSETDYFSLYEVIRSETFKLEQSKKATIQVRGSDVTSPKDNNIYHITKHVEDFIFTPYPMYDTGVLYDGTILYDVPNQNEEVSIVYHTDPRIPRDFQYKDGVWQCASNQDSTDSFELLRSADPAGPYEVVATQPNVKEDPVILFSGYTTPSGTSYYKSRAVSGTKTSLPTLSVSNI